MNQVYIAVPVSIPPTKTHNYFIWRYSKKYDYEYLTTCKFDAETMKWQPDYGDINPIINWLEPREGYFLEREELEVKKLVDDFFVIKENDPNPYRDLGDLGLAVAKIFGYLK